MHVARERRAHRGDGVHDERHEDHRPAPEAVGERAVKEEHEPEGEEIPGERLLDLERGRSERGLDSAEGGEVRVDREWTEGRQRGEERSKAPAETPRGVVGLGHLAPGATAR